MPYASENTLQLPAIYLRTNFLSRKHLSQGAALVADNVNPYLTNGFSHHDQLDESTVICRGVRSDF